MVNEITDAAEEESGSLEHMWREDIPHDLVALVKQTEITYDDIVTQVQKHINPIPVVMVQHWAGRKCGPNSEGGSEENDRIIGSENCKVPVQISHRR